MTSVSYKKAADWFAMGNYELARPAFEKILREGDVSVALSLGWMYQTGHGGAKSQTRAEETYRLYLASDEALASYYLGSLLKDVPDRQSESLAYFEKSADMGNPSASYWAYCANTDKGNQRIAEKYLRLAIDSGHLFAL